MKLEYSKKTNSIYDCWWPGPYSPQVNSSHGIHHVWYIGLCHHYSDITWTSWHVKSPTTRVSRQQFARDNSKKTGRLWGESTGERWIPSQRTSGAKNVMMSWLSMWKNFYCLHVVTWYNMDNIFAFSSKKVNTIGLNRYLLRHWAGPLTSAWSIIPGSCR